MDWTTILVAIIAALLGGGGGAGLVVGIMKQRSDASLSKDKQITDATLAMQKQKSVNDLAIQKQESDIKLSETDKAFTIYKEVVADLRQQMDGVFKGVHDLETQLIALREEKAVINAKLEVANATIEMLNQSKKEGVPRME